MHRPARPPLRRLSPQMTVLVIVVLAVAVGLPLAWPALERAFAPGPSPLPPGTFVNATISVGAPVGEHPADPFFAVVFSDVSLSTPALAALGSFFNHTPITWYRFGGGGEGYDPTSQTNYVPPVGGGTYTPVSQMLWNLTWFHSWCASRTPPCHWLGYRPGELNNTPAALHTAEWYHSVLGFAPDYW